MTDTPTPDEYVSVNRDIWDADASNWAAVGARLWAQDAPEWGNWGAPEGPGGLSPLLPADMTGMDAIELGCGTAYVSAWMARRGARVTAIDISPEQLATARRLMAEHGAEITILEGNAEQTGLPDASFDFAISEYGAAIWCRPELWLAEAARLLRPGGALVFLGNHPISLICAPLDGADTDHRLHRPYKAMWGADWTKVPIDPHGICFNLTHGDWYKLFAQVGFEVTHYQELYIPDHIDHPRGGVAADWGKHYPPEQVWHLRKSG